MTDEQRIREATAQLRNYLSIRLNEEEMEKAGELLGNLVDVVAFIGWGEGYAKAKSEKGT